VTSRWLPGAHGPADSPRQSPDIGGLEHLGGPAAPEEDPGLPLPWGITACADHLRRAGPELDRLPAEVRIAALSRIARSWLDPDDEIRSEALDVLPGELGSTPTMVAWALDAAFGAVTPEVLRRWWQREGQGSGSPPNLSAHIQAGNVFVAGLPPVLASLLAGVPAVVKAPSAHPSFPVLLARSVAEHAPELGPCVGAAAWGREAEANTEALLRAADVAFVFGDDSSVAAVRALAPQIRVHGFGHKVSVAVIPKEQEATAELLDALATDALAFDGAGCLTPRWILVEGPRSRAVAFARSAAERLPGVAAALPSLPLDVAAGAARAQYLGLAGFAGFVAHGPGWLAAAQDGLDPAPPPRSVCFVPVAALADVPELLAPLGRTLQGVALGGGPDPDSRVLGPHGLPVPASLAPLTAVGLSLLTSPGQLQRPPLDWNHDDVRILASLR
jgi:phenylacetate-CoA ligase